MSYIVYRHTSNIFKGIKEICSCFFYWQIFVVVNNIPSGSMGLPNLAFVPWLVSILLQVWEAIRDLRKEAELNEFEHIHWKFLGVPVCLESWKRLRGLGSFVYVFGRVLVTSFVFGSWLVCLLPGWGYVLQLVLKCSSVLGLQENIFLKQAKT